METRSGTNKRGLRARVESARSGKAGVVNPLLGRGGAGGGASRRGIKINVTDVLLVVGLGLFGAGLFLWWGLGVALTVVGGVMFLWGMFGGGGQGKGD